MKTQTKNKIPNKVYLGTMLGLVVPIALQNLINVAVQSADVLMLGSLDEYVLSAANLAGQVQFVLTLFFFGMGSGAAVLTAQYWGKGDKRTIEKVLSVALRLSFVVGLLFFLAAELMPEGLMRIFSTEEEVIAYGVQYLRLVAPSYLFMSFTNVYLNIMRTVEKVLVATLVYFVSFVVNVIGNALLIFGLLGLPALGIEGAAIATTTARAVELVIVIIYAAKNPVVRLRLKDFMRWPRQLMRDFVRLAGPTTLNELMWGTGSATINVIIGRLGANAVAAYSVAGVVRQLATVVCFGVAAASGVVIGKSIGSGDKDAAREYARRNTKLTLVLGAAGSGIILAIRPLVMWAMNLSDVSQGYLSFLLFLMAGLLILTAHNTTMIIGVFRGGGDTKFGLFADVGTMWLGSLLWGALAAFVFRWPVEIVFLLLLSDEFIKALICQLRYRTGRWLRDVTR